MTIQNMTRTEMDTVTSMKTFVCPLTFEQFQNRLTFVMAWHPNEYLAKSLYNEMRMSGAQDWSDYHIMTQYLALEEFMES